MDSDGKGLHTGFGQLDELIGGLRPGELTVLAARPAIGKTAFATNVAFYAAKNLGARTLFFSVDVGSGHLERRLLSFVAGIDASRMRRPSRLEHDEWMRLVAAAETVRGIPLFIEDNPSTTVWILEDLCREASTNQPFDLVVVDRLETLSDGLAPRRETCAKRDARIERMTQRLKALAARHAVPVLALAGIDRRIERREDHRPLIEDLPVGGRVAELADTVIFIYRDEVYVADSPNPGIAEVIVAKEPRGRTGTVRLCFNGRMLRFEDA